MSANLENKKKLVEEIKTKIAKAKSIVLVDYRGINVAQDTRLRAETRKENIDYKVYKNRLISIALKQSGIKGLEDALNGTTAVAFGYEDEISAPRVMAKYVKSTKKMVIKAGVVNNAYADASQINRLANIPSKEVLIATMLRTINGPVAGLARALNAIATK